MSAVEDRRKLVKEWRAVGIGPMAMSRRLGVSVTTIHSDLRAIKGLPPYRVRQREPSPRKVRRAVEARRRETIEQIISADPWHLFDDDNQRWLFRYGSGYLADVLAVVTEVDNTAQCR
jgi:hypothetical protein